MIKIFLSKTIFVLLLLVSAAVATKAQMPKASLQNNPWKESQLMAPEKLAAMISQKQNVKIYNIGVVQNIKGAIYLGAASEHLNLEKLRKVIRT